MSNNACFYDDGLMATLAEQLANVQAAIEAIEDGAQSYTIGGRSYTRANLETLYRREERLQAKTNRAASGDRRVCEF